jgi:hypothetical protein
MGTFATLTDMATEIKAAAVAETAEAGSGAALVTFTDATAVTTAVAAAVIEVESYVEEVAAAAAVEAGGDETPVVVVEEETPVVEVGGGGAAAVVEEEVVIDTSQWLVLTTLASGATWSGGTVADGTQNLAMTLGGGTLDITSDVQVEADDFTGAFSNSSASAQSLGSLSITNLKVPTAGSGDDQEVTIVITGSGSEKITVGFNLDWSINGSGNFVLSSDDTSLDVTYVQRDNSSVTVSLANTDVSDNTITVSVDGSYGSGSNTETLNVDALGLIAKLEATGNYVFSNLESRFATAGTTLEVNVDVTTLPLYAYNESSELTAITNITSTIDIV